MNPMFAQIETGSVIVAVSLIALVAMIMVIAMLKYPVDGVLKLWGGLGTLVGLITGTIGTYFFTREAHQQEKSAIVAEKMVAVAEKDAALAQKNTVEANLAVTKNLVGPGGAAWQSPDDPTERKKFQDMIQNMVVGVDKDSASKMIH